MVDIQPMIEAALQSGKIVKDLFGRALETTEKSSAGDLRTQADTDSENAILSILKGTYPTTNVYAEESGVIDNKSDYTFVIDPLDGTNNFVLGIPRFAISIGLLYKEESVLGVIYNPMLDQLYAAEKGKGATLNGNKIRVSTETDITRSTVSYTCGYKTSRSYTDTLLNRLQDLGVKRLLNDWGPAFDYCLLASGRIEAVISKEGDLEDYVAAKVIVTEAGGKITDFSGNPSGSRAPDFIATNSSNIHDKLLGLKLT